MSESAEAARSTEVDGLIADLDSFSFSIAHDLRAPVRAIAGYTLAIQDDYASVLDAEGKRFLSVVASEAARMNRLIDDLLDYSRIGRQPMKSAVVDMTALARLVAADLALGAAAALPTFDIAELPRSYGDLPLLRIMWTHVLSNAIKFSSRQQKPHVEVRGSVEASRVVFRVTDNGVGFDMAYADKLFGVFQKLQADSEFPGTGVGLATMKRIVQRHGGKVWADSRLGGGATFSFDLPGVG